MKTNLKHFKKIKNHKLWIESFGKEGDKADLRGADLRGANLNGANLPGADLRLAELRGADLRLADLRCADLSDADLSGPDLSGANLSGADLRLADLRGADLRGANLRCADLRGANLRCADLHGVDLLDSVHDLVIPTIPDIHKKVYEAASRENALNMEDWHTCETTHCRAGWAVTLAGYRGRDLEAATNCPSAAWLIYNKSDPGMKDCPDFYCTNDEALEDMRYFALLD